MNIDRRNFTKIGALVAIGATELGGMVSAAEAYQTGLPLKLLSKDEAATLGSFADKLALGAEQAGVVNFVDYQLSVDPNNCLLLAKYFQVKPPYLDFYRAGLKALNGACVAQYKQPFVKLNNEKKDNIIGSMFDDSISDWQGPPASLFYLLTRSDAVDVVYGTPDGFKKLNVPYMAHIMPPKRWDQQ